MKTGVPGDDLKMSTLITLHLLPGLLTAGVYIVLGRIFYVNGLPSILGFYASTLLVLVPWEVCIPVLIARRTHRKVRFGELIGFREKAPIWQLILLGVGTFLWAGLTFSVAGSVLMEPLRHAWFSWVPDWFDLGHYLLSGEYSQGVRIFTWGLGIAFVVIIGPIVEELYFRGYLLPRMSALKGWAPLVGSILFALYHFWSPWFFVVRIVALLPMMYAVWWKRDIRIVILAHCLLNLVGDTLMSIPMVFG